MVYKKVKNEEGRYKDNTDIRWDILEAHEAWTPEGLNVGWTEFESEEAAATAWGLVESPLELDSEEEVI